MKKYNLYWISQIAGWGSYAMVHLLVWLGGNRQDSLQLANGLAIAAYFFLSTHYYRNWLVRSGWLELKLQSVMPRILPASILLGVSNFLFNTVWEKATGQFSVNEDFTFSAVVLVTFATGAIYLLWNVVYLMYHYFERYKASLKYEAAIKEMELNKLKSQLNPHFMFNALNSIRALVDEEPKNAKEAITQLSNILRNSLIMSRKKLISFQDEVRTVRDYLALEQIRYEERLRVEWDIDPECMSVSVPPMMMQTLVENGIKHGVSTLPQGGVIRFESHMDSHGNLCVSIRNSGQLSVSEKPRVKTGGGYGVENTKERLRLIYGDRASFSLRNESEEMVLVELTIPEQVSKAGILEN
ncbi:sensor histidine kinase [Fulvitalea axinellae]